MRTKLIRERQRSRAWRNRARDLAFTAMLVAQCLIIFAVPFAAMGYEGVREVVALLFFIFTFLVCVISPGRVATALAILAFISGLAGGRWFWIADNDVQSKYTFGIIMLLFSIADTGTRGSTPIVTIPANQ